VQSGRVVFDNDCGSFYVGDIHPPSNIAGLDASISRWPGYSIESWVLSVEDLSLVNQSAGSNLDFSSAFTRSLGRVAARPDAFGSLSDELYLKLLIVTLFVPEGLSFFVGNFRFSIARVLLIILSSVATARFFRHAGTTKFVRVPSDIFATAAGIWMILAAIVTAGPVDGFKGGGVLALEFTGAYYVFRNLLGPVDSSVRITRFSCKLIILVVSIALLDPLTGKLFTYEVVKGITGYTKEAYEFAMHAQGESIYRDGLIRAMGPLEHSILFGSVCAWFGILALFTFPSRLFGWSIAVIAFIGVFFSQSQGSLASCVLASALAIFYLSTRQFEARWKVLGTVVALGITFVFLFSGSPVSTLLRFGGISAETGWYRQAIWEAAIPVVAHSPLFGIGLTDDWNWQASGALVGGSVDAMWLELAMMFGIPGSALIFLTVVGSFWRGPIDKSLYLSGEEKRLSVALGLVTVVIVFQGFTVHIWGTCWILLGVFSGMRANLAEAAVLRARAPLEAGLER
jgi:hypothetical protein